MKIKSILAVAIAALALVSCNKDNGGNKLDGKASLTINVVSEGTRAAGTIPTGDATITKYAAFISYSNGSVEMHAENSAASLENIAVTTDAQHVYIIANYGNADLSTLTTVTALEGYIADLTTGNHGAQTATRWATGKTDTKLSFTENAQNEFVAEATVNLSFVAARITLNITASGKMLSDYDPSKTDGSLILQNVAVLNVRQESKLFGASLVYTPAKYLAGIDNDTFAYWPATADYTVNAGLYNDAITANTGFGADGKFEMGPFYYYVFENDAVTRSTFPTIVTIVAEYEGEKVYYPVHLAPYEQFATGSVSEGVKRGNSYDINIDLSVDPVKDGDGPGGPDDPTDPKYSGKVTINVSINDWIPVVLSKEF